MKQSYILLYTLAFASLSLLASCQKDSGTEEAQNIDELITFSPVIDGDETTRGTMVTGTVFGDRTFKAACWTDDSAGGTYTKQFDYTKVKKLTLTNSEYVCWSTVDENNSDATLEYFWKGTGTSKTKVNKYFYAYTNLPSASGAASVKTTTSQNQQLTYDITKVSTAASQTDILLGYYNGAGVKPTHGTSTTSYICWAAPINFRHPLSAIKFVKGSIEGWTGTDKISSISISGVYEKGTCTDNGTFSWGSCTGSTTVSMSDASGLSIGTGDIIGESFFLIPQTFAASTITVNVSLTIGGSAKSISATLSADQWVAGKYYTYTLGYSDNTFDLSVSLADWGEIKTEAEMEDGSVMGYEDPSVKNWTNGTTGNVKYTD